MPHSIGIESRRRKTLIARYVLRVEKKAPPVEAGKECRPKHPGGCGRRLPLADEPVPFRFPIGAFENGIACAVATEPPLAL
jgi:hypothetical protein